MFVAKILENHSRLFSRSLKTNFIMKLLLIFIASTLSFASSYKILGVFPFSSKSHYAIGEATMLALHEAGHEVTMISVHELKKPIKNYRQIKIVDLVNTMEKSELRGKLIRINFFFIS